MASSHVPEEFFEAVAYHLPPERTDKVSTTKADHPGLADAVSHHRESDVLVIWKLDWLGRTVKGVVQFVADLHGRKIQFRSSTDGIDTTTPAGRFSFHAMASQAQKERELLAERTQAGLAAARRGAESVAASGG
jgi:DNA invertase Pin-like site-specific DNA recombinase